MVLKERKLYMLHIMALKGRVLCVIWASICRWMVLLRCKQLCDWLTLKYQQLRNGLLVYDACPTYEIGMKFCFAKQYGYVTNHLILYVIKYHIVVLLLFIMCLTLVKASISSYAAFTCIGIVGQSSWDPMDLYLQFRQQSCGLLWPVSATCPEKQKKSMKDNNTLI